MWVYSLKHFKTGMLLFAATIALAAIWTYLPHVYFFVIAGWGIFIGLILLVT
jgi:hypothetical protein